MANSSKYTTFQTDEDWRLRHDESGAIFTGFKREQDAIDSIELIEDDLGIGGPEACGCGCGEHVTPGSRFRPGHDARHKGNLIRRFRAGDRVALHILKAFGWEKFLREEELWQIGETP